MLAGQIANMPEISRGVLNQHSYHDAVRLWIQQPQGRGTGFTLVELSIVLVITGLLIGGILVGQSLIENAKISKTVNMLGQFDASVGAFKTKYKSLPGDTPLLCTGCNNFYNYIGNGDGFLSDNLGSTRGCVFTTWFQGEIGFFWAQLSLTGLKTTGQNQSYTQGGAVAGGATAATLVNTYIPKMPLGTNVGVIPCGLAAGENYYMINNFHLEPAGRAPTADSTLALTASQAAAIDAKIDDGVSNTGYVKGTNHDTTYYGLVQQFIGTYCQISAGKYNVLSNGGACGLQVRIGLTAGNLQ